MFNGGTIRYDIEVNSDGAVRSLQDIQKELEAVEEVMEGSQKTLSQNTQEYIKNIDYLQKQLEGLESGTDEYNSAVKNLDLQLGYLKDSLGLVAQEAEDTEDKFSTLGTALSTLGFTALAGTVATGTKALTNLASKGIQATNFLETSRIGMAGLTGSIQAGNKALSVAANYWQNNPFNRFDVTNATKSLVQFGRSTSDLQGDLEILGNVSLSTGVQIDNLAYAYGRVASRGKAATRDIEMMAMKGVPIYRELAKELNTTQAGVRELAAKGQVDFETFRKAMEGAVNPEAMEEFENTLARQQDRLSGSISILAGELAGYKIINNQLVISSEGLYTAWTKLTKILATGLRSDSMKEGLQKIGETLANLVEKVIPVVEKGLEGLGKVLNFIGDNSELIVPILGALAVALGGLASKVPIIGQLVKPFTNLISLNPGLLATIAILGTGFVKAYKESDTFKQSIQKLVSALGQLVQKIIPVVQQLGQAFIDFATSPVVLTGLELIVGLVADLADILASLPVEVLVMAVGAIIALKLSSISPWLLLITSISLLYSWAKKLIDSMGGLHKVLQNAGQAIKDFVTSAFDILNRFNPINVGKELVYGFVNGVLDAIKEGKNAVVGAFNGIITSVKNLFGIHSPSTVFAEIGENIVLGLADGITGTASVMQKAMDNLAKDTLKAAEKAIGNRKDYGLINLNGVYKDWKKVSQLFAVGSEQYNQALQKMEDARKAVNLEILKLQQDYNNTLDESIRKIQKFYGIFDEVSTKGGKNSKQIIKNLDRQVAQMSEWEKAQQIISGLQLDPKFIEELQSLGVDSVSELSSIANMTTSELEELNNLWLQKQAIGTREATRQLEGFKDETLQQISDLADGIEGETVNVKDVGGRLVSELSEGITDSLPTIESAMAQLGDYIAKAKQELSGSVSAGAGDMEAENPADTITQMAEEFKEGIDKFTKDVSGWLLAGIAVIAAVKFGPSIINAVKGGLGGGGIKGALGGLFGGGVDKATGMGSVDLSGMNKGMDSLASTGESVSKFDKIAVSVMKGAGAVIVVAAAIASIAGAIWVMDNALKDIDWGTFISKLGMVAAATVAMGVIAGLIGAFIPGQIAIGGAVILELAVDIAAIALALGFANIAMDGMDWEGFGTKLGMMAAAIAAMGVLAAIAGIGPIAALMAIGGAVILELALDIAAVSLALGVMNEAIPDDVTKVESKLELLVKAIGSFELLTAIGGLLAPLEGLGIIAVIGIAESIKEVALALMVMYLAVPDDLEKVETKMDYIKHAIQSMGEANLGNIIGNMIASERIKKILPGIQAFAEIAQSLQSISATQDTGNAINNVLNGLQKIIESSQYVAQYEMAGQTMAIAVANGIAAQTATLSLAGQTVQASFWSGLQSKMADEFQQGVYLVQNVYDGGWSIVGTFTKLGNQVQSNFWQGVQSKMGDEYQQGIAMGETLRRGLYDVDYANAGWWAVQGFINGANNRGHYAGGGSVYWVGYNIANEFLKGLKDRGEQGSPWKTTKESGVFAVEGLIDGIKSMENQVVSEAETLADGIVNALSLDNATINPTLDVSSLVAPSSGFAEEYAIGGGRNIVINQSNVNYSEYDYEQSVRDLSYSLSRL